MPTIVQTVNGKVTGLWGSALRRMPNGKLVPLKMGDEVHKGDVILTTQDGLVQLTPLPDAPGLAAKPAAPTDDEIDRVIAELNDPDAQTAPAAGLTGADGGGLQPGLRVGRIAEDVTPVSLAQTAGVEPAGTVPTFTTATAPENQAAATPATPNDRPTATPATVSGNEDATLPISLGGTDTDGTVTAVTIVNLPANGTLLLADGVTAVTAGQVLTPAQAAGLVFRPAPDFNGGVVVEFTVTDNQGSVSAVETVSITVLPVNDTPLANAGIATAGPEYSSIPVSLAGTDIDGTVTAITVTSPPAGGSLFLSDGVTPVVPGTALTPAQAANLVFVPNPGFTGSTPIGFTVTDNEGASSSAAIAQVNVTPVPTTVTLSSSAPAVAEGGSVVYTATVDHPVAGAALVITLSNGSSITIPVGQTSGSSTPVVPRADDAYVQGTQTQTIGVTATTGGNFSSLVTTSTVATSVSDDADSTTVSLSASAASVTEGGSIVYTATLTSPVTSSPLVVTLSNGQTITIPVGASSGASAPFAVRGDDAQVQGTETLTVNITGTTGGNFEAVTPSGTATTTVTDDADVSTVTLTASAASVVEGGSITYTATTSAPVAGSPLVVTLSNGATITIPVGASSASSAPIAVRPDDSQVQGTETVTASITGTSGSSFESLTTTGTPSTTVTDNADGSTLTLSASAASVAEGGSVTYTASVTAPVTGSPLVVTLSNGQTVTIPVGASSASSAPFAVRADDAYAQGDQTLSVSVTGTTGGAYEALATSGTATTVVTDDTDATTATLTASAASVTEGGSIVYTATLNNVVTGSPVVLTLSNGQTITIPVGASSASSAPFAVRADDAEAQGTDTLNVGITTTSGGNFEAITAGSSVSTTVTDDADPTTVTVSASAANVTEGGSIVYTVSLSNAVSGSPLTVTLSNGQSVTLPVGASSASTAAFNVRPDDVNVQADDTLTVTVTGNTGGNFEALTPTGSAVTTVSDDADVSTVTLTSSAASVAEGGSVVYTASVSAPVVGAPLVISLTNGQTITIPVGQSTADSAPFAVRADDHFVQGAQSFSVGITGTTGGSYEALATTSTVSTTVTDDADVSTVTLSATPSVAEGGTIVYTATLSSAAQTAVVVTLANGSIINIAAGASSGTVNVAAPTDDVYLDAGTVSQTIASATGGNFESLQVNPAAASTTVTDTLDATTVSLTGDPTLSEAGTAAYTVSLTSVAQTDVTVTLTYTGTAANGADFTGTTTVTIPAGSSSASFSIAAIDDALAEGPESFTVAIGAATGGNFESLVVSGANGSVTTGIVDNDISTVSLSATPTLTEAGGTIVYTASVTQAPTTALDVTLSNGAVITIAAGALSGTASVPVAASDDVYVDPTSISATIASTSGGGIPLAIDPVAAVTTVTDTIDTTTLTLTASNTVAEGGSIVYTATLSNAAQTPVSVTLSNGATLTIAAGATQATVSVAAPTDDVHVDAGSVSATITHASGGNFESLQVAPAPAVTTITDTVDTTTVSLTATPAVAEGGTIVYTASLTSPAQTDVTVTLSNNATITIAAGASTGTVTVPAPAEDVYVDAGNTSVTITSANGGNFENLAINPAPAVTAVSDTTDTSTVTLTATPSVAEGGNIVYTATLSAPAQSDVTVTLSNGATITILANTSSGSVPVAAPTDDVYLDAGSVSVTIAGASGGNFESLVRNPAAAVTTITDTVDASTVTLTASPAVAEGGNIVYTATLSAPAQSAVTVTLSNNATITIAAGASTGTVSVAAPTDDVYTDAGSVSATISTATGGDFENLTVNPAAAITAITDTVDTTTVSLTATPAVAEGGSIVYTASLTSLAQGPVTVTLQSGATITIPNGAASASITVPAPGDDVYVDAANVSDRIVSAAGGNFENLAVNSTPAVTAVSDTIATTTVSLTASSTVAEGGNITYTASLTSPAQTAVTVTLSDNSTITIPAGASSASISLPAPADDVIVDAGSVSLHITGASGGNFEALAVNATPAVTAVTDTVDTTTVSLTGTPSVAEGGSIVYTASLTAPADTAVTVRLSNNALITIAAGASSGSITVAAPTDDVYNDAGNVSVRIDSASGGNFENLAVDATPVLTTVSDTLDTTTVSLTATPAVAEGGSIVYTASLTAPAQGNVTVTLQSGATITILSGASSGSVTVPAPADDAVVDAGSVSNRITGATGGNFENLAFDATPAATTVSDTLDTTTVSLSGSGSVIEGQAGSYTVSLTNVAQTAVTVSLTYSGTAADGSDFTGVTTVTIPAGASSANFSVTTIDDAAAEGSENFTVAIGSATGGNFENLVVSATNGSVTTGIVDNDVSVVSLSATNAITEAGGSIVYTASLTQAPVADLTVTLSNGATITVTAGSLSGTVTVPVAANEDVYVDPTSISATITGTSGGGIALNIDPTPATTAVNDTIDTTTVSLSATPTVAEGGSIVYTATLTSAAQSPVTVNLSNGQQITIATGATTGTLTLAAPGDDALVDTGSVSLSITSASGGNFESLVRNPAPAVTTVTDTVDTTTVTLTASPTVAEGGNIVYTATLNNAAGTDVTVTLSNGAQIVIAAGTSSNSVSVPAPTDDVYADAGNVSATITATSGGNFESLVANPAAAVTAVTDTVDTTTVTLTATPSVAEGGNIVYTVTLTSPAASAVTVTLSNNQTITIPTNASSATLTLPAPGDDAVVDAGPVSLTIASATGGGFENLVVNPAAATTTVTDTIDTTTVSLSATATVAEGGNIVYTASLTSPAGSDLTVTLSNNATITILAGTSSGSVSVPAPVDDVLLDASTVSASIATVNGGNFEQLVVDTTPAPTAVTDTIDTTTVSLTATPTVAEGGNIVYTASLNHPAGTNVTVTLSNSAVITILTGNSTGTVTVPAPADDFVIDAGPVSATIASATGGNFEALAINPAPATTAVTDTIGTTTLTLSATATVAEGGSIVYTASLTSPAGTDLVVTLSNSQTITIPAGSSSASISVAAPTDDALIDAGSVSASITGTSGGNFENLSVNSAPATTSITDTIDTTTVSLTATGSVAEGGNIVYTASLNNPAGTDVTITLSNNAQITILAGASTGTVTVAAPADDALVDAGNVSATITTATGGNFENLAISPTAAVTSVTDTVDTTTATLTATPSVAEGGSIVYTASLNAAAGSPVTITLSNGAQINIAAGASSGSVSVLAPTDDVYLDASTVSAHITGATGGNFESLVTDNTPVATSITDTINTTTVSLSGSGSVAEGASGSYTVSLTSPAQTTPVTVTLSYSGTAADGSDFTGTTTVTIPAGSSSANFSVATIDDALAEGAESFTITIATATGGNFENLAVSSSAGSVTTGIVDNDISTLTLSATPTLTEAGGTIVYTATLTQAPVTALDVTLSNGQTIHINAGALTGSVTVPVAASDDVYVDPTSVSATITGTSGGGIALSVDPTPAVTSIVDTVDTTTVNIGGPGTLTEGTSGTYTLTLTNPAQTDVTVTLAYSGSASAADRSGVTTVTIPAGATSATFSVAALDDALADSGETVIVTIAGATGGNFENLAVGPASSVTTTLVDEATPDTVLVSLTGPGSVTEGATTGNYTVTLGQAAVTPVTVNLNYAGTAVDGSDYNRVVSVTIPAGATSATFNLATLDDVIADSGDTIVVSLGSIGGGGFEAIAANGAASSVTTVINDETPADVTTVSLSATNTVAEGGNIVYTAQLTSVAQTDVTVQLSNSQQIVIPAGSSSASISVPAPGEDVYTDAGNVSVNITGASGGGFESLVHSSAPAVTSVTDTLDTTTLSLSGSASVSEGASATYTLSLTSPAQGAGVTVTLRYSGTAADGSDFTGVTTVTIPAGSSATSFNVATIDDNLAEGAESFTVTIDNATGGNFENLVVSGSNASVSTGIVDNDVSAIATVSAASAVETVSVVHTVTLSNPSATPTTYSLSLTDGTATGGTDYTATLTNASFSNGVTISGGVITVPAGVTSFTVSVPTLGDTIDEADETYTLNVGGVAATGTVLDDDAAPTIATVSAAAAAEGTNLVHTVTLSNASSSSTSFAYTLGGGTATAGVDYGSATFSNGVTLSGGNLIVPAGVTSFTVTVPSTQDTVDEPNETYNLSVGGVAAVGTIGDDDAAPTVSSVSAATQVEGTALVHTVTLTNASSVATSYAYTLGGGTATSGSDYTAPPSFSNGVTLSGGNLIVPAGVTSFTVTVPTTQDTIDEGASETYNLSVGGVSALGTITDDDNAPTIASVSDASAVEATSIVHTVTLSNPSSVATTYSLSFTNGTASAADYTSALTNASFSNGVTFSGGTITVPAGVTSFTVTVPTTADTIDEADETYTLNIGSSAGTGTITDDDAAPTVATVSAATQIEGTALVHTVTLSNASSVATSFAYTLGGGTATGGGTDYGTPTFSNGVTLSAGNLIVPAGVTSFTVTVPSTQDTIDEPNETYNLSVGSVTAVGTINDDDNAPTIASVSAASATEGASLVHTVTLTNASSVATSFAYTLGGGTATGGGTDYGTPTFSNGVTLSGGNLIVPAGVTSFTVTVPSTQDTIDEPNETYNLSVGGVTGVGTINDDDNAPSISSVSSASAVEATSIVHTVTLTNPSSVATSYSLSLTDVTASSADYTSTLTNASFSNGVTISGGTITVPAGVTSFTVTVATTTDTIDEADETYTLTVGAVSGTGTINDDDAAPAVATVSPATQVEGTALVHTVTLTNASSVATTYAYSLGGGTATAGSDYTAPPTFSNGVTLSGGVLTVPAGVTSFTVTVPTTQDTIDEGASENYTLNIGGIAALGTITDDDNAPTIASVSAASATEGSNVLHTVTLSNPSSVATTYTLSLADGTASSADYTSALTNASFSNGVTISGGTITVPAGVTSFTVSVPTTQDTIDEPNETYTLTVGGTAGTGTINDDDNAPTIASVSAASATEGASLVHTVTLTNASSVATSFAYTLGGGTATGGTDYGTPTFSNGVTLSGGNLIVPAGVTSFTVTVPSTQDTIDEPNETYNLSVGGVTAVGTINDDDNAPTISSVSSAAATEASNILHTVTLSNASSVATTYALSFTNGTASGADYTSALTNANFSNGVTVSGGTITVPAGVTSFTVSVPTTADTLNEANETYTLTVGGTSGTGTINDDDAAPSLTVNDVTVNEAAGTATFTVTLSAASGQTVSVNYGTGDGTATAGSDYTAASGTLVFTPGVTSQTITVPILNDGTYEGSETFNVNLSNASNATIADSLGVGTIRDDGTGAGGTDNDTPTLAVSSASFAEGSGYAQFTVSLSNPSATATTVSLSTTAGTATAGTDYGTTLQVSTDGGTNWVNASSATIAAGATSVLVRAPITNDTLDEVDETFSLTATRTAGTTTNGAASGTATLLDDDATPTLSINDVTVNEAAGTATFTVTLSAASGQTVSVSYNTGNGTATAGSDYTATTGTLTFTPGVTSQTITVAITNDSLTEATETFFVNLIGASNATISDTQGVGSIVDNDAPPAIDLDGNNSTAGGNDYSATFTENGSPVAIADTDIAITDVDSTTLASATITLTNAQAGDVLAAGGMPAGITASVSGNVVTLTGSASLAAYQTAIRAITYANTSDNPSTTDRQISVVVNDGTSSSAAATAVIHVAAVNDAPVNTVPAAQSTAEDTPLVFSAANGNAITVTDVDSGSVTTTVSVNNGTLTLGSIAGVIVVGNGTGSVQITGTPAAVTAALNGTAYANTADYNGPATLTVSTSDGVAPPVVSTVGITVNPVVDIANDTASTNEDNAVTLSVLANDSFENGGRTITAINGSAITAGGPAVAVANGTVSLNASGQLIYTPTANYNGAASFSYTVTSGGVTETATVNVTVNAVNDAPVNTVPATQTTAEDTSRSITGLAISDVDGGSGSMTVTLAVTNGTLTVSGGTATIANSGTGSVTLTGTIAQINATLASNVTYVPSANFNGAASLTMTTNDNGNTGSGGAPNDTDTVTINVTPVNDAPVATGSAVSGTEDTALVFNWAQFGVTDIDSASSSLGIRVSTLPADGTLQVYNGSAWVNVAANTLVTKATIDAGSFRFVPDANESGSDAYGGSSAGNQQADYARFTFTPNDGALDGTAAMMRIDIAPVADAPTVSHNASVQVTGTLSTLTSVGLSRDYYNAIATLTSGASSTNPDVGEVGIETAVPTSSALVTNVGVAGNLTGDTGVQVAADDAYRVQGLIYMQAGTSYVFSGYADDTVRLEVGGNTLMSGQWGGSGQAMAGTFTSNTFTPTVTGYYSIEFMVYNTSGPGSYDLNVSVNGATAVDLSTSNFLLFQSINQVDAAGGQRSAFIPNATTGEGGYYPVVYDAGVQSRVYLAPVLASLVDTDGSESLAVTLQGIPVGAVLTDGTNTFTASGAATSVNITTWNRSTLSMTFTSGYTGSTTLTAVATSTEAATGATATTSTSFSVTVDPTGTTTSLAEIGTFNGDALIGQAGNDVYSVSQVGTGLTVSVTQGATGSIPAQSGTDTTGTIHQAFNTGAGNDYVQAGAGDDTIYLGDTGSSVHPVGGGAPTQAHVAAARVMTLADDTTLTSSTTGLFTAEADDTNANNNSAGNTSITTWSDVANGGSGNDVIYGQNGTDFLYGGTGNDYLNGGAGIDGLRGGAGDDTLVGGAGNDVLRGDAGADVFRWEFADRGTAGAGAASDIIMDFNTATPANGGDVLDLRDLLQGEASAGGAAGNLSNYLHFTVSGGTTTIAISSTGGFSSGYSAGAVDQSIVLQNVDLTSGGALTTDQQIINDLLNKSKLLVDGT